MFDWPLGEGMQIACTRRPANCHRHLSWQARSIEDGGLEDKDKVYLGQPIAGPGSKIGWKSCVVVLL
jgi:hypothetical protein